MLRRKFTVLAAVLCAAVVSGCGPSTTISWQENGTPAQQHPSQTWWKYQYVYYPQAQVYFEPYSLTWYWFEDELWHQGSQLPQEITVHDLSSRVVKLATQPPYEQHDYVASSYGPYLYAYPGSLSPEYGPNVKFAKAYAKREAIGRAFDEYFAQKRASSRTDGPNPAFVVAAPTAQTSEQKRSFQNRPDTRMTKARQSQSNTAYATAQPADASGF